MSEVDQKELAKNALNQIRKICDGNGAGPDSIQIINARGEIIHMDALTHIDIDTHLEQREKAGKLQHGTFLPTPEAVQEAITKAQDSILKNNDSRKFITEKILNRPDKGFYLHGKDVFIEELQQDFSTHAPCLKCQGQGQTTCSQCNGQRQEVCTQCHGRTMIPCRNCSGSGFIQGPNNTQKQCNFCFGRKQVSCPLCRKTGRMNCRKCRASGHIKCYTCNGAGAFTQISSVIPIIKTLFEMNRADLPDPAIALIERSGSKLVENKHIHIQAEPVKRKDEGLAIKYKVTFPYGKMEVSINGKPLQANIFGYKAKLVKLKPFLEDLIKPALQNLKKAANKNGSVANNIKKARTYKIINNAILFSATMPLKKATICLKKKYPIGISNTALQKIIKMSDMALGNVTRKARYIGLISGLAITSLIYAGIFLSNTYQNISSVINSKSLDIILSIILVYLGGAISNFIIKLAAIKSMERAIGHIPNGKKIKISAKTRTSGFYAYIGAVILFLIIVEITRHTGALTPVWYPIK